jgi:hypothetical protein
MLIELNEDDEDQLKICVKLKRMKKVNVHDMLYNEI